MAVAAYYQWDGLGRPLTPALPVREMVERLKVEFPRATNTFSWHANEAHYTAVPPLDHTPYSSTGWPLPSPHWVVFATDVMHRPDLGVDCFRLFEYWIGEARAGRFPSLKYIIWRGQSYSVQRNWEPATATGHYDHIHLSFRTDYEHTSLGTWSIVPKGDFMAQMLVRFADDPHEPNQIWLCDGMLRRRVKPEWVGTDNKGPITNTQVHYTKYLGPLGNDGKVFVSGGDKDVWGADITTVLSGIIVGKITLDADDINDVADVVEVRVRDALGDLAEGGAEAARADA